MAERLSERIRLCQAAAEHMGSALTLLDQAGAMRAAALLDQALHAIPGSLSDSLTPSSLLGIVSTQDDQLPTADGSAE